MINVQNDRPSLHPNITHISEGFRPRNHIASKNSSYVRWTVMCQSENYNNSTCDDAIERKSTTETTDIAK